MEKNTFNQHLLNENTWEKLSSEVPEYIYFNVPHNDVQTQQTFQNTFIFILYASQKEKHTNNISLVSFNKAVTHVAHCL